MKKQITLKEIAQKCKVSTATVSFVINNKNRKGISEATWFKIENILKKYGYKKNKSSKQLKRIVFCFESSTHLATSRFLQGIDNDTLYKNEFIFLFNAISNNLDNLNKIYEKYNPDGIIISTGRTRKIEFDISKYKSSNIVLLNCWADKFNGISILPSDYNSTKKVIKSLLDSNKKNIAIILPENYFWQGYENRLSGWRDAHFENNVKINSKLICRPIKNKKYESDSEIGYESLNKLIKNRVKINTIFAMNDFLAMGCYQAAKENNLNIPRNFSIIGFDNSTTAINLKPSLSSINLPIPEMTSKAIQHIFDEKNYDENFKIFVDCDLIQRNST